MAVKLIVVGATKEKYLKQSEQEYLKRLTKFTKLQYVEVGSSKKSKLREECLAMEAQNIIKHVGERDHVILLDENGDQFSSRKFAQRLNHLMTTEANLVFLIGGAFGFSEEIRARAKASISLSKLTFPHHLVRTIFLEQLYRAFTILNGGKYHND